MPDRFCGQDEYHDPGADFEEVLACSVCGDNGKCVLSAVHVLCSEPTNATQGHPNVLVHVLHPSSCILSCKLRRRRDMDKALDFCTFRKRCKFGGQEHESHICGQKNSGVQALTFVPAAHRQCARDEGTLASDEGT